MAYKEIKIADKETLDSIVNNMNILTEKVSELQTTINTLNRGGKIF